MATLCPRWLGREREDLVQTSMVRILERMREGGVIDLNATYLWKTAYTVVLDEMRRVRHQRESALDETADPADPTDPERRALSADFIRAVQSCLSGLAPERRRAVQLRLAGFRYAEAARLLSADEKRTANLVFRGFEDLRSCLRGKGVAG